MDDMTAAGLYVIANCHLLQPGWCCSDADGNGLWYNGGWPSSAFSSTWFMVARRFASNPLVGYDLKNEPRKATVNGALITPTWGDGVWASDFRRSYQWHAVQKAPDGNREGFGLVAGQDWLGSGSEMISLLRTLM